MPPVRPNIWHQPRLLRALLHAVALLRATSSNDGSVARTPTGVPSPQPSAVPQAEPPGRNLILERASQQVKWHARGLAPPAARGVDIDIDIDEKGAVEHGSRWPTGESSEDIISIPRSYGRAPFAQVRPACQIINEAEPGSALQPAGRVEENGSHRLPQTNQRTHGFGHGG